MKDARKSFADRLHFAEPVVTLWLRISGFECRFSPPGACRTKTYVDLRSGVTV